jgi:poly-gamma-glutamate capsule biosynthesis protein CapA/YwtB (metallophosphatase superfamily)
MSNAPPRIAERRLVRFASAAAYRLAALLLAIALGAFLAIRQSPGAPPAASRDFPATGPLTVAGTGDTVISRPLAGPDKDAAFDAISDIVRGATLAITNLEMNLLASRNVTSARRSPAPRWPFGSAREAEELAALGFDVVGQANNHAADYGPDGMADTSAILTASGLVPAGTGRDLDAARTPVVVGSGERRIALLAVAISASTESMATPPSGIINGRPGVNPLRYAADVTVDARTYETLRRSASARQSAGSEAAVDRFTLLGTSIRKGAETSVDLVPDARDLEGILAQVARARAAAEIVVLSVHSHEPSNDSDEPAELFRRFAHQAIDAGAQLVVGHGPHRLRGVEMYKNGAILYSVGNFLYRPEEGQAPPSDPYDAGLDMYSLAMGMSGREQTRGPATGSDAFWEGIVAVATFDDGALRLLQVHPIDLGRDLPANRRGVPRKPALARAVTILERLVRLSEPYDTSVRIENGVGMVEIK